MVSEASTRALEQGQTLIESVLGDKNIMAHLSESEVNELFEPSSYLGCVEEMMDAVLSKQKRKNL